MLVFDGVNKTIQLDSTTLSYTDKQIYSRWKDWVIGENANFVPAFRIVGGDDLGGGLTAPTFVFLQNDKGWRIKKPEANIAVVITGNLVGEDGDISLTTPPDGDFLPDLTFNYTNVAGVDTGDLSTGDIIVHQSCHLSASLTSELLSSELICNNLTSKIDDELCAEIIPLELTSNIENNLTADICPN